MSEASESAHVRMFLADYAVADHKGKLTLVGAGISIVGIDPQTGMTPPFSVVVVVSFHPNQIGQSPAIELALETESGELVYFQGHSGALRVGNSEKLNPTVLPGMIVPNEAVRPRTQLMMQFQNGLPLPPGNGYLWRVRIDQDTRDEWTEPIYIASVSSGPVIG